MHQTWCAREVFRIFWHPFVLWPMWVFSWNSVSLKQKCWNYIIDQILSCHIAISYFVVHPTVPFGRDLGCIIGHMDVWCVFNPSITSIEVVIIFKIFITIFIRSNQFTNFQFIKPGICTKLRLAYLWIVYCVTLHNHNTLSTQCIKCHINLPIQLEQTVSDTTVEFNNLNEFE